ncbi:MAG TPA: hypothetical protein VJ044_17730, partial [Candidatus Hodarchaeales archaeon]|nr:hypothetical protein [Candidatus Hodarchaeales archaeon]
MILKDFSSEYLSRHLRRILLDKLNIIETLKYVMLFAFLFIIYIGFFGTQNGYLSPAIALVWIG